MSRHKDLMLRVVPKSLQYKINSWRRDGERIPLTIAESKKLLRHNYVIEASACWLWKLKSDGAGYGVLPDRLRRALQLQSRYAHIAVFTFWHRPPKLKMQVCHTCDVPSCGNPKHLWEGTNQENQLDGVRKGRVGHKHSDATRRKMSRTRKGRVGHKHSDATRRKMSRTRKGMRKSETHKAAMSAGQVIAWQRRKGLIK